MATSKNTPPYYDDYDPSKKYYQILFRPGLAVQARELSQMQSILQKQIDYFGKAIYKEGAMVIPGESAIDFNYAYVKLEDNYSSSEVSINSLLNKTVVGLTSGALGTVVAVSEKTLTDKKTLFVKYSLGTTSQNFTGNIANTNSTITNLSIDATKVLMVGMKLSGVGIPANAFIKTINSSTSITLNVPCTATTTGLTITAASSEKFSDAETISTVENAQVFATTTSAATGLGSIAYIKRGVYFINGYFCLVDDQQIILDKYSNAPSCKIGLSYRDAFITPEDDETLNDPALGSTNYNAPGGDRYYIDVVLDTIALDDDVPSDFIELIRVENGQILSMVTKTEYSELEKTLARRTFDESGDYTVKNFPIQVREHLNDGSNYGVYSISEGGDANKLVYAIDAGKAYVKGYEIELQSAKFLEVNKPRTTAFKQNYNISSTQGSYVDVDTVSGNWDISSLEAVVLRNSGNTQIGAAKVRGFEFISGTPGNTAAAYRIFLFDIVMNSGQLFSDVRKITKTGASVSCILSGGKAVLNLPNDVSTLFTIPEYATKSVSDISYTTRRYHTGTMTTNTLVLTAGTNETFASGNIINYHVSILSPSATATGNGFAAGSVINMTASGNSITLGGSPVGKQVTLTIPSIAGSTIAVISTVIKGSATIKTKTLTTRSQTLAHGATITLDKADIFDIVSIIDTTTAENVAERYYLDNGQRDSYYDRGALKFYSQYPAPAGNITVVYRYFAHGNGDLFTADSYNGVVDFEDIAIYTSSTSGLTFDLVNTLDFRPRKSDDGSTFSVTSEIVADSQSITFDYEYYLGRIDKIVLDSGGNFSVISGSSDINPLAPKDPSNSMVLYQVALPPYTFIASDAIYSSMDNKRYTMRDIGKLDKRISNLEYYTTLSLLEKTTSDMFIDDSTGNNAFKNGFIVDNFKSHMVGNTSLSEYQCSIDDGSGTLRPPFTKDAVDMKLKTSESNNYTKTGTLITLPYTEKSFISQPFASKTMNVNPYAIYNWLGNVVLSPSSDTWFETTRLPDYVIFNEQQLSNEEAALVGSTIWGEWETNWAGAAVTKTQISDGSAATGALNTVSNGRWAARARASGAAQGVNISLLSSVTSTDTNHNLTGTATYLVASTVDQTRTNLVNDVTSSVTTQIVDDKVIDTTVIPYCREKLIEFIGKGLKPNTTIFPYFDNIDVSQFCKPDKVGAAYGDSLITDSSGYIKGYFNLPCTDAVKFRTGERTLKFLDNPTDVFNSSTSGEAVYTAQGVVQTKQSTILSTKRYELVQKEVNESQTTTITNTETQRVSISWHDPLAQTFLIENSDGVFLSKINIYFASKDDTGIPVRLQIRNTVNGVPGQYVVPMSDVFINPEDITTSADGSVATSFTFASPIYLTGGNEYCFVLLSNSNKYNVWISELGGEDIATGSRISQQPYAGVMFKSQNASTWTDSQEEDIKFEIFRCAFNTSVSGNVVFDNDNPTVQRMPSNPLKTVASNKTITVFHPSHGFVTGNTVTLSGFLGNPNGMVAAQLNTSHVITFVDFDHYTITLGTSDTAPNLSGICGGYSVSGSKNITIDTMNFNAQTLTFTSTALSWGFKGIDITEAMDAEYSSIISNQSVNLNSPRYILNSIDEPSTKSVKIRGVLETSTEWISPVIDTERLSLICISNRINNSLNNETNAASGDSIARYVTKRVNLETAANGLRVYFNAIRPNNAAIQVYAKIKYEGVQTDFDTLGYTLMTADSYPNFDDTTLKEYSFNLKNLADFSIFAIKIVMVSSETSDVPVIKDFRAIATGT